MKTLSLALLLALLSTASTFAAPVSVTGTYTQDFDSLGTGSAFPAGWSVLTVAGASDIATPPTSSQMAGAAAGSTTLNVWNQTQSSATWGSAAGNAAATASDTNRLLATSPTGTMGSVLQLAMTNGTGATVTKLTLAYDMKVLKIGTKKSGVTTTIGELPGYRFYYLDDTTWTRLPALDLTNTDLNSIGHAVADITFTTPVAVGGSMQVRWFDDNDDPLSPDTMLGIDNVTVTAVPEPATMSLLVLGGLALIRRNRK